MRWEDGSVDYAGNEGTYWTGSIKNAQYAHDLWFHSGTLDEIDYGPSYRGRGYSVRCIKN